MSRHERGVRALGLSPSSRLSRPPQLLQEPDVRPRVSGGNYYINTGSETNIYGLLHHDLPLSMVWDDATEIGGGPQIDWDTSVSISFLQVGTDITIREYTAGGGGGNPDTGYFLVLWDSAVSMDRAELKVEFYSDAFTLVETFTATNFDDAYSAVLPFPNDVSLPEGGLIKFILTVDGGYYSAPLNLYAETWLHWTET